MLDETRTTNISGRVIIQKIAKLFAVISVRELLSKPKKKKIQIFPVLQSASHSGVHRKSVAPTAIAVAGKKIIVIVAIVFVARLSSFSMLLSFWQTMLKALAGVSSRDFKIRKSSDLIVPGL